MGNKTNYADFIYILAIRGKLDVKQFNKIIKEERKKAALKAAFFVVVKGKVFFSATNFINVIFNAAGSK